MSKQRNILARYMQAQPEQFGTLHQRMKYLLQVANAANLAWMCPTVWNAIWDLEMEVKNHEAATPPFGSRPVGKDGVPLS